MKVECKIQRCALGCFFVRDVDRLFIPAYVSKLVQSVDSQKYFFKEFWQPLTYLRVLFMARIVRVISVQ